jgi:hypothetical protein
MLLVPGASISTTSDSTRVALFTIRDCHIGDFPPVHHGWEPPMRSPQREHPRKLLPDEMLRSETNRSMWKSLVKYINTPEMSHGLPVPPSSTALASHGPVLKSYALTGIISQPLLHFPRSKKPCHAKIIL